MIVLSPVLAGVAVLVRATMGSPVLFSQPRPGKNGELFTLHKFRTMTHAAPEEQPLLRDQDRMTWLGRIMRELSLDELPELWNLLQGDMSLVGPRPLLVRYYPYFTERERLRFEVRPGITGWAQINGRSNVPWDERLEMDAWYVENRSLKLDLVILFRTALRVIQRRDVHVRPSEALKYDLDKERQLKREGKYV